MRRVFPEQKGAMSVIVAFVLVVLLGFAALVVDAGVLFQERRHLQNAMDAAAMAGAEQIVYDVMQTKEMVYVYAEKNGVSRSDITQNKITSIFNTGDSVTVSARRKVNLFFAPVLGTSFQYAEAKATAIITQIEVQGIWPWGVTQESVGPGLISLKLGSRNSMIGNFMALDFPSSSGADHYRDYIMNGYNPSPAPSEPVNWWVDTETGNVAGPTIQGVDYLLGQYSDLPLTDIRNPRVGIVPILAAETWSDVVGKSSVEILDFAVFYLEGISNDPAGMVEITGSFRGGWVYGVGRSENIGGPLEGLVGARLWE